eukprot:TRINITY_DN66982_c0_g1_i1.p1 TRINITY_DN66982_c0_g1~~TRINITY_DN66982_c0_g1_i1.p1  ORF type:complete len:174 (-),score=39.83 TRINITY_DN66982_c0_g1_i1:177-698(-)
MRSLLSIFAGLSLAAALGPTPGQVSYDCSAEEGITSPVLRFQNVSSDPPLLVKGEQQYIYKTIASSANRTLTKLNVLFHQYYSLWEAGPWMTFLRLTVDECKEHSELCPLEPNKAVNVVTKHPPMNPLTPAGWYRSRQLYSDAETGEKLGCIDMHFKFQWSKSLAGEADDLLV